MNFVVCNSFLTWKSENNKKKNKRKIFMLWREEREREE